MGKSKNKKRRGFSSQTLYKYIRLIGIGAPAISGVIQHGFTMQAANTAVKGWTGVDLTTGQFNLADLAAGWTPALATVGVTYGVPKIAGLIRSFGK